MYYVKFRTLNGETLQTFERLTDALNLYDLLLDDVMSGKAAALEIGDASGALMGISNAGREATK